MIIEVGKEEENSSYLLLVKISSLLALRIDDRRPPLSCPEFTAGLARGANSWREEENRR